MPYAPEERVHELHQRIALLTEERDAYRDALVLLMRLDDAKYHRVHDLIKRYLDVPQPEVPTVSIPLPPKRRARRRDVV